MRNRIEVSGYKFVDKKVAESEVDRIINDRKNKIAATKKAWTDAVGAVTDQQSKITGTQKQVDSLLDLEKKHLISLQTFNEAKNPDVELIKTTQKDLLKTTNDVKSLTANLNEYHKELSELQKKAEHERQIKVKRIKSLKVMAYHLLPVKSIGKHGGNWVFESESTLSLKVV